VAGTFESGPLVHAFGHGIVLPLAIAGLAVAELLMIGRLDPEAEIPPAMPTRGDLAEGHW
jgi:hypothetical protein